MSRGSARYSNLRLIVMDEQKMLAVCMITARAVVKQSLALVWLV